MLANFFPSRKHFCFLARTLASDSKLFFIISKSEPQNVYLFRCYRYCRQQRSARGWRRQRTGGDNVSKTEEWYF